jgi:hypothetical protein
MARHLSSGCPFNREYEFGRYFVIAIYPVPYMLLFAGTAASPCESGLASHNPYRSPQVQLRHSHIVQYMCIICKNVERLTV